MSLSLNDRWPETRTFSEDDELKNQCDLDRLDRYLAIMETNKKACRFVPDDAFVALDMAGFVRGCLKGKRPAGSVSAARMAMALVQKHSMPPVQ